MTWQTAKILSAHMETAGSRTLVLDGAAIGPTVAGQHIDIRLTAPDGYTAERSYSLASPATEGQLEVTVDRMPDGEVSPYLVDYAEVGSDLEIRGPIGGWFVWRPEQTEPVQLIAGGSGVVPLMSMIRTRAAAKSEAPFRLVYSVRMPEGRFYVDELKKLADESPNLHVTYVYTRSAPAGEKVSGRLMPESLAALVFPASDDPSVYVCGPNSFVEAVASGLMQVGIAPGRIKTERFGGV